MAEHPAQRQAGQPFTLAHWLRHQTHDLTSAIGRTGHRLGLTPDGVTIIGTLIVGVAAWQAALGNFLVAGLLLIFGSAFDVLDGAIARAIDRKGRFGAFLDSTLDRYADGFLLGGLVWYFAANSRQPEMAISLLALIGAYLVSYTRARAEGLGIACQDGWFSRVERTLVLIGALLTGWIVPGIVILAIGSHTTAIQRIALVFRATRTDDE